MILIFGIDRYRVRVVELEAIIKADELQFGGVTVPGSIVIRHNRHIQELARLREILRLHDERREKGDA